MTTSAKKAQGTLFQYGDAATPELFKTWAEVFNIEPGETTSPTVNVTSHDSTAAEFLAASVPDYGEVNAEAFFINDATDTAVRGKVGGLKGNWQMCLPNWGARTKTFTAVAETNVITAATHLLTTGQPVRVSSSGTPEDLPAGLVSGTTYYVHWIDANTFTLHTTNAGALADTGVVDITDAGTGTHTVQIGTRIDFAAVVTSSKNAAPLEGALTMAVKAKLTGAATYV